MSEQRGRLRVGTSGYQYDHWKGVFYPPGLPRRRWFEHYAAHFDTVEVNNTFYRLPGAETFAAWREAAPAGFEYAVKFSRYGSHIKRLKDPHDSADTFVAAARYLEDTLGPILVQLPPNWRRNTERIQHFLQALPEGYRWVLEFRDADWLTEEVFALLEGEQVGLCVHDMVPEHPRRVTADFVYLRYHGEHYAGRYPREALQAEAETIRGHLAEGLDVYAYFNNDAEGHAVTNARELRELVDGA